MSLTLDIRRKQRYGRLITRLLILREIFRSEYSAENPNPSLRDFRMRNSNLKVQLKGKWTVEHSDPVFLPGIVAGPGRHTSVGCTIVSDSYTSASLV